MKTVSTPARWLAVFCLLFLYGATGCEQQASRPARESKEPLTDKDFEVPDGKPAELLEYVQSLNKRPTQPKNEAEAQELNLKRFNAMITAADKILAQNPNEKMTREAVTLKLIGLVRTADEYSRGTPVFKEHAQKALAALQELQRDKRPGAAAEANNFSVAVRALNLETLSEKERADLIEDALQAMNKSDLSHEAIADATYIADRLVEEGETTKAVSLYERIAKLLESSDDKQTKMMSRSILAMGQRIKMLGSELPLAGRLLDGSELDWASYRGKVVLVDFWATWCGPCLGELPNVKANYEKYHDRGFDVVGVSLDHDTAALKAFVEREKLPWAQMYDAELQEVKRQSSPMAVRFGVAAIPTALLVDKDGKVVSINARGPRLGMSLEKLLGTNGS